MIQFKGKIENLAEDQIEVRYETSTGIQRRIKIVAPNDFERSYVLEEDVVVEVGS